MGSHSSSAEQAVKLAKTVAQPGAVLADEQARAESLALMAESGIAMVASLDESGHPRIKAMLKMETEGLKQVWFSTNTSSKRVAQFLRDARASVYFVDATGFRGLLLVGEMEVRRDAESRRRLWREGFEMYYPKGIDDPDYTVLRFVAREANYYHGLSNRTFAV